MKQNGKKNITDTIKVKSTSQGKMHNTGSTGGKSKGKWKEVRGRRDLEMACSTEF